MSGKRKSFYQRARENKGKIDPFVINVDEMAANAGVSKEQTETLKDQLRERIRVDAGAASYVFHSAEEPNNLFLSAEGICVFHDILSSYFDNHSLSEAMEFIMAKNKVDYYENKKQEIIKGMTTEQIKGLMQEYEQKGTVGGKPISQATYQALTDELRERNLARIPSTPSENKNV